MDNKDETDRLIQLLTYKLSDSGELEDCIACGKKTDLVCSKCGVPICLDDSQEHQQTHRSFFSNLLGRPSTSKPVRYRTSKPDGISVLTYQTGPIQRRVGNRWVEEGIKRTLSFTGSKWYIDMLNKRIEIERAFRKEKGIVDLDKLPMEQFLEYRDELYKRYKEAGCSSEQGI